MKKKAVLSLCLLLIFTLLYTGCSVAVDNFSEPQSFSVSGIFSSNMVIQRNAEVPVFGSAEDGLEITVNFNGQTKNCKAENGEWKVYLDKMDADSIGKTMTITSSQGETSVFRNILVGEVWLCAGQSNMEWLVEYLEDSHAVNQVLEEAENPMIRECRVIVEDFDEVRDELPRQEWVKSSRESIMSQSAYASAFAQGLQKELGIPVGVISIAKGSTRIERWIDGGSCFNSSIYPIMPFRFAGLLWYQGEHDCMQLADFKESYPVRFKRLCELYREGFEYPEMPVIQTQLAGYMSSETEGSEAWADMQLLQVELSKEIPDTYTVYNQDYGHKTNIHPAAKKLLGQRAANLALEKIYGIEGIYGSSPSFKSAEITQDGLIITFEDVHGELELARYSFSYIQNLEACGGDMIYKSVKGKIYDKDKIIVDISEIENIKSIKYCRDSYEIVNLCSAGVPVFNFEYTFY